MTDTIYRVPVTKLEAEMLVLYCRLAARIAEQQGEPVAERQAQALADRFKEAERWV